jgi:hypothetical protein
MALTDAEKQRHRRERLKKQGLVHVQGWVSPDQAAAIKAIMQGLPTLFQPKVTTAIQDRAYAPPQTSPVPAGEGSGAKVETVTCHHIESSPEQKPKARPPRISPKTIKKWKDQADSRAARGLTVILEHFQRTSHYEDWTYAVLGNLLPPGSYRLACRAEAMILHEEQGLSWTAIAKVFNARGLPRPRPDKGKWTGPKVKALLDR